ncbi:copper chaperone PCu(A)C [Streptomyces sp. CFMR 7]|uniref:copper chaperone PCu(A)C n=1 Tax=Streptomyces sp. CFMR 7 TaxID=1649184 RepID=UPI0021B5473A|nr:copper chaperone PCu(A)C [Streptomyces sp. CFMR 7]
MTNNSTPSGRPRRIREATMTGAVVALASLVAVGSLSAWTTAGYAGSPARIEVSEGRVLLPVIPGRNTNAYFRIVNTGGAPDRLVSVITRSETNPELTVHRMNTSNGAYRERSGPVDVPAYGEVEMSPHGPAVTLRADPSWRPGERVTFTLDFRRSGKVTVDAVVRAVTPGSAP